MAMGRIQKKERDETSDVQKNCTDGTRTTYHKEKKKIHVTCKIRVVTCQSVKEIFFKLQKNQFAPSNVVFFQP